MKNASARQVDKFRGHARFILQHHFGTRPARITERGGGLSNFVFEAKHPEGDFIVRISPDKGRLNAFIKEHWCERTARKAGIPTAEILETGDSIIPFPYAIARRVRGSDAVNHPERGKIIHELGRLAAKINSIRTRGFGETFDWSNNELSRNTSLQDYLKGEYRYEDRIVTLERSRLCPPPTIKALKRVARELLTLRAKPVLNHGDLRLKNVIVDEQGKIVAVIDWEKATSNIAPHWELSLALHDLGVDGAEQFVSGYRMTPKRLAEIAPYIKAFNLLNYTDEINRATEAKDKLALHRLRSRFAGNFDMYSFS
ncbi:MAG TPA: aminoglycoside phosphotransferase family protein [Pyrinomonadaceae bacterium]